MLLLYLVHTVYNYIQGVYQKNTKIVIYNDNKERKFTIFPFQKYYYNSIVERCVYHYCPARGSYTRLNFTIRTHTT